MRRRALIKTGLASIVGLVVTKVFNSPASAQTIGVARPSGQPVTLRKSTVIRGTPEQVFGFFSDPDQVVKYIPNVNHIRNVSRPIVEGSTWNYEYSMAGLTFEGTSRATRVEAPSTFAIHSDGGFASEWLYTFTPAGPNQTRVNVEVTYSPPNNLVARIARPSLLRMHDGLADQALANARVLMETA